MYSNSGVPPRHSHTLQGTCRLRKLPGPFNVAQGLGVSLDPHTLAVVPAPLRLTLYELEERLTALADSTELVAIEQEQEFLADFQAALLAAKDKRDPVSQFLAYCESQSALAPSAERVFQASRLIQRRTTRISSRLSEVLLRRHPQARNHRRRADVAAAHRGRSSPHGLSSSISDLLALLAP